MITRLTSSFDCVCVYVCVVWISDAVISDFYSFVTHAERAPHTKNKHAMALMKQKTKEESIKKPVIDIIINQLLVIPDLCALVSTNFLFFSGFFHPSILVHSFVGVRY